MVIQELASLEPAQIRARQEKSFAKLMREVWKGNAFYRTKLEQAGFRDNRPIGTSELEHLPLTTIAELQDDRRDHPPFGTNLSYPPARYTRMHQGWLDTHDSWAWWVACWTEVFGAAGVTAEDRVFVACDADGTAGSWAALEAGQQLGALTAVGTGTRAGGTLDMLRECGTTVVVATPEDAGQLLAAVEGRSEIGRGLDRWILHAAGVDHDLEALSSMLASDCGARCHPVTAGPEIGVWGFGCEHGSLHVHEAEFIAEVVDPRTAERIPPDDDKLQCGQLVLTNLGRAGSPVIRLATDVMVELSGRECECGRRTRVVVREEQGGVDRGRAHAAG